MSNYKISRLYLDNYKLFVQKELVFTDCSLAVFDGPNGYGKTSVFDAIEFLITDDIKRISENSSILKTEAYETVFIAGNPKKDVVIKAEFISEDNEHFIISKVIPATNKIKKVRKNNPTKFAELAKTYILPSYESNDFSDAYLCNHEEVIRRFGTNVMLFYDLFYYIKQEDRLDFLKKTEKDRMAGINSLFNMQKEKDDLDNANKVLRQLNKLFKDLEGIILAKKVEIMSLEDSLQKSTNTEIKYEKLLSWKQETEIWDEQVISINDISKKNEMINIIEEMLIFVNRYNDYIIDQKNNWCREWLDKQSYFSYFALLYPFRNSIENIRAVFASIKLIKEQSQLFSEGKYVNINYTKIAELLKIDTNLQLINEIIIQIANYEKSSNTLAKAASELNQAREILNTRANSFDGNQLNNGCCAFCGYDWGSNDELTKQITKTSESFKSLTDESSIQKEKKIEELKAIYTSQFLPSINEFFEKHKSLDNEPFEYIFDLKNQIVESFKIFIEGCAKYEINIDKYFLEDNNNINYDLAQMFTNELRTSIHPLSTEYINACSTTNFLRIFNRYFGGKDENVKSTTIEKIKNKIAYIEYYYYNATFEKIELLKKEQSENLDRMRILNEEIIPQTSQYKDAIKSNIEKYQNQVIKHIEIPFYIYSGRIMQSYQGGLGVLIKEADENNDQENESGLNSIRFISPSRPDHDIIYTLSSGQLSAVVISFTLALNKIYSKDTFKCIFIDDPVQTMDELNIASFVELIRNEFEDRQIILSTHEDSFSRYIRYKYSKYGLRANAITLKSS